MVAKEPCVSALSDVFRARRPATLLPPRVGTGGAAPFEYALERLGVDTVLMPPESLVREGRGRRSVRRGVEGVWVDMENQFRPYYLFCRSPFVWGSRVGDAVQCRQHTTTMGNVIKVPVVDSGRNARTRNYGNSQTKELKVVVVNVVGY